MCRREEFTLLNTIKFPYNNELLFYEILYLDKHIIIFGNIMVENGKKKRKDIRKNQKSNRYT